MINLFFKILDWIFPKTCSGCKTLIEKGFLCPSCYEKIKINNDKPLIIVENIEVYSATSYANPISNLIKGLKYNHKKKNSKFLAKILYNYISKNNINFQNYEIIPVPLHKKRLKKRNYNHMSLIAKEFSKLSELPINENLVKRTKNTKPQHNLNPTERRKNLKNAFELNLKAYTGKPLLIIDDIYTTGSTINEVITCLKQHQVNNISVLILSNPKLQS